MTFVNRNQIVRDFGRLAVVRAKELFAGVLLGTLIVTLGMRQVLSADALVPVVTTLLFTLAAAAVGFALVCRRNRTSTMGFDIAGVLTFVGIAASILIEPDQMIRLLTVSEQP